MIISKKMLIICGVIILYGTGMIYGKYTLVSIESIGALEERLISLEKLSSVNQSAGMFKEESEQSKAKKIAYTQWKKDKKLYTRLNRLEHELLDLPKLEGEQYVIAEAAKKEAIKLALDDKKHFQLSINVLEQAAVDGVLDKTSRSKLDKMVKKMDRDANRRFWKRMFADLEAGKYELVDDDEAVDPFYSRGQKMPEFMDAQNINDFKN